MCEFAQGQPTTCPKPFGSRLLPQTRGDPTDKITVTGVLEGTLIDRDVTTTVRSDGNISTEVEFWPDPPDDSVPDLLIPDNMTPVVIDVGTKATKAELEECIKCAIVGTLILEQA